MAFFLWQVGAALTAQGVGDLQPVPHPHLEGMEESVQEELRSQRRQLDALLAAQDATPVELAESFGLTGQLYLLYDLKAPARACLANAAVLATEDPRWPYYLGYLQQADGELDGAAESFRQVLALRPEEIAARVRLGQVELAAGRLAAAREAFTRALVLRPDAAAAHAGLARVAESEGQIEEAVRHYEAALAAQPAASSLHYPLAVAYRRLGRLDEARTQLEQRGEQPPAFPDPLISGLAELGTSASPQMVTAGKALAQGRLDEALEAYRLAVEAAPDSPRTHRGYGAALARAGELEAAIAQYRRALELEPADAVAYQDLGALLLELGRVDEAAQALETATELAPDLTAAYANLAAVYGRRGQLEQAVQALDRVLALSPQDRDSRRRRAVTLLDLGRAGEAADELQRLVAGDPSDLRSGLQLGRALARTGEVEEARNQLQAVISAAAGLPALAARAHLELARLERAREGGGPGGGDLPHLQAAVELAPELAEAHYELGSALLRAGRAQEAVAAFERAVALAPQAPPGHLGRARALLAASGCPAARSALDDSLARLPRDGDLLQLMARLLATCPEAELRDGQRALELALSIFQALPSPEHAETVAMALAELGRFDEAAVFQQQALAEAQRRGAAEAADLAAAQARLAGYRRGEPCRTP